MFLARRPRVVQRPVVGMAGDPLLDALQGLRQRWRRVAAEVGNDAAVVAAEVLLKADVGSGVPPQASACSA